MDFSDYDNEDVKFEVWNSSHNAADAREAGLSDDRDHQRVNEGLDELERRGDLKPFGK
ncbi:hypothetical protein ACH4GK_31885 [Streptomyces rimosus]|uniref:Uncharacterized protein n=1 Tax=Streptomyces chrestomyceticus JCM 4735 TaxID=1306181 RepID=A0A7U9KYW2_9ACTN|nr:MULTISPECIES: hypothetical protein [Streptomyces]GCD37965.1 hypothetical protein OEIGOIKO_05775 [Streptomyces chrestomyceticus JCM 4735]